MSNEPRHLRDWIVALYAALDEAEPQRAEAIRKLAGDEISRMALDKDRITLRFVDGALIVRRMRASTAQLKSPHGATDRHTVTALLRGYMEISEAISNDHIRLHGTADQVMAICAIIEILVDASTRIPALQRLAEAFLATTDAGDIRGARKNRSNHRERIAQKENSLLRRHGLL
ncbi:hypothetical protein So717_06590 [Roseobacter cerasinus]|uniref:SCP2 domain-containing protein n=1 Tax=Roseobacter cerasinus TaxID=2602289 RepID=A0A640VRS1_9RHOB|nr:hypothetical protein [Roseobacter cerasinus]GFE48906.1 hypothetical protein So717_06590 [Roseobacter cerasinus]